MNTATGISTLQHQRAARIRCAGCVKADGCSVCAVLGLMSGDTQAAALARAGAESAAHHKANDARAMSLQIAHQIRTGSYL